MPYPVPIRDWTLIFDDEFNGTSLSLNKWTPNWLGNPTQITPPINSAEKGAYDPKQVSVKDGFLHLKAERRTVQASNGNTYPFVSGCVTSNGNFNPGQPLYIEALITLVNKDGKIPNWPAFWLNGQNWPNDGEIDIFEGLEGQAACHIHTPSSDAGKTIQGDFTGKHLYACLWNGSSVEFYYDGVKVWSTSGMPTAPKYIILNQGVGGYGGPELVPCDMMVHYVHAYSNAGGAKPVDPEEGYGGPGDDGEGGSTPIPEPPNDNAEVVAAIRDNLDIIKSQTTAINQKVAEIEEQLDGIE